MCDKCVSCNEPSDFIDVESNLCLECLADSIPQEENEEIDLGQCPQCGMSLQNYNGKLLCSYCNEREIDNLCFSE